MLLRLAYLGVTNVFAVLRPLPVSSRDKDEEMLALGPDSAGSMGPCVDSALWGTERDNRYCSNGLSTHIAGLRVRPPDQPVMYG